MKYSRKQISKAGEKLLTSKSENDVEDALNLINNWRTNHLHPLVVLKNSLLRLLKKNKIEPNLVSQRLKRLTSIEYKLDLNPSMGLGGMQDIGGYRAVLKDVKDLNKLNEALVVLVSATSIKTLKKVYPSYFLDTSEFIQAIEKMNSNCKERNYVKNVG